MPTPSTGASIHQHQQQQLQLQQERTARANSPDAGGDTSDTMRFYFADVGGGDRARGDLPRRSRHVVAANRIRRGGIGGFFASDLGVEVTVALDDETMEQALRADRGRIGRRRACPVRRSRLAQQLGVRPASLGSSAAATPTAPVPVVSSPLAAPMRGIGGQFDQRRADADGQPGAVRGARRADGRDPPTSSRRSRHSRPSRSRRRTASRPRHLPRSRPAPTGERAIAAELATAFAAAARAAEQQVGVRHDEPAPTTPRVRHAADDDRRARHGRGHRPSSGLRHPAHDGSCGADHRGLSAITAEPVFGGDRGRGRVADRSGCSAPPTPPTPPTTATWAPMPQRTTPLRCTRHPRPPPARSRHRPRSARRCCRPCHLDLARSPVPPRPPRRRTTSACWRRRRTWWPPPACASVSAPVFAAAGPAAAVAVARPGRDPADPGRGAPDPTLPSTPATTPTACGRPVVVGATVPGDDDQAEMARMAESVRRACSAITTPVW